ncbi:Hca operon transcriptional activator [Slackia heliotrinireducens]|uniref:Transcriptional regulator n=1 Tax=Slackia heliotrinireducens (strain ATCC 29202 / DSM 20476 / NCTC 11029 / RHS 1) TaxID=471855 RepID=C7N7G8_SLAHD|nr:LysR family transcriptional regulator [Slackia heliotrinireducens]ACV22853.1 transcriptional regulator [Slackia heliotrinireducens DSM 20476]VEH01608.1 Hca operon transcriptional activator [Slackia heliotrinireducens]
MNTTQLECFVQVADNLNFRRAADELHLSQPTVSKQVASLEDELGGALFTRSTREVLLTPLGVSFLPDAREILRMTYAAAERARKKAEGVELAIGYSDPNELMRLSVVLDMLRKDYEGFHVTLSLGPRDANIDRLLREQLDIVLGFKSDAAESERILFRPLHTSGLSCVVRKDSPLAEYDEVGHEEVEGFSQVICLPANIRRKGSLAQGTFPETSQSQTIVCSTTTEAFCLVDAGFGYALIPAVETMPDPHQKALIWRNSPQATYGAFVRNVKRGGLVPRFLEIAQDAYAQESISGESPSVLQDDSAVERNG